VVLKDKMLEVELFGSRFKVPQACLDEIHQSTQLNNLAQQVSSHANAVSIAKGPVMHCFQGPPVESGDRGIHACVLAKQYIVESILGELQPTTGLFACMQCMHGHSKPRRLYQHGC
jgi:hypothetical protein